MAAMAASVSSTSLSSLSIREQASANAQPELQEKSVHLKRLSFFGEQVSVSASMGRVAAKRRGMEVVAASTNVKSPAEAEWKVKREALLKSSLRSVSAKDAVRLIEEQGYTIIDVRPPMEYEEAHPVGAINIAMFRLIKEWTPWDIARRTAFAFFGIFNGTEENPEFLAEVAAKFPKDGKIIVACAQGGTTKPSQNFPEGKQSRSLIAAYMLVLNGYTNVLHLDNGILGYYRERLPVDMKEAK